MIGARALTSLFFPSVLVLALPAVAARPVIDSATADSSLTTVTINGSNLAASTPRTVFLSGFAATSTAFVADVSVSQGGAYATTGGSRPSACRRSYRPLLS